MKKKSILSALLAFTVLLSLTTPAMAATKESKSVTTFNGTVTISNVIKVSDPYTDKSFNMSKVDKLLEVSDEHRSGNDNTELYFCDAAPVTVTFNKAKAIDGYNDYGINGYQVYYENDTYEPKFDISRYNVTIFDYYIEDDVTTEAFNGTVTLSKPGTYYFYLTNYSFLGEDCDVGFYIVVGGDTAAKKVTSIKLNKTTATLAKGKTVTLKATVKPADASNTKVTWTSSNTKVATVDKNGKVKAVGKGTATITCKAADGSGKKATCKITVK